MREKEEKKKFGLCHRCGGKVYDLQHVFRVCPGLR